MGVGLSRSQAEQWAVASICGPKARDVLARLTDDIDLSPEALPHMAVTADTVAGLPARVFRVSFPGELSVGINVPRRPGPARGRSATARLGGSCASASPGAAPQPAWADTGCVKRYN